MKAADGAVFQPLQDVQTGLGSIRAQHPGVGLEAASQRPLGRGTGLRIGVHDQPCRQPGAAAPVVPSWMVMVVLQQLQPERARRRSSGGLPRTDSMPFAAPSGRS
jgi:hypothetical protein